MNFEKTLIFTVTPGRSGSKYLTQLLNAVPGVYADHEPDPNFAIIMRRVQYEPSLAISFLRDLKLPAIAKVNEPIYAETSNVTCKGFIEPMVQLGLRPGLILLRRPPREVAWSLLERNCIPARTPLGFSYLVEPRDPFVIPLPGWESMSDYQLCFWYAIEIEHRCKRYKEMAASLGMPIAEVTNKELNDWETFSNLLTNLKLPATDAIREAHTRISMERHNPNAAPREMPTIDEFVAREELVWKRISFYDPLLQQEIERRYARSV